MLIAGFIVLVLVLPLLKSLIKQQRRRIAQEEAQYRREHWTSDDHERARLAGQRLMAQLEKNRSGT